MVGLAENKSSDEFSYNRGKFIFRSENCVLFSIGAKMHVRNEKMNFRTKVAKIMRSLRNFPNVANFFSNVGRIVIGCVEADSCDKIPVLQHFAKSKRVVHFFTALSSKLQPNFDYKINDCRANSANVTGGEHNHLFSEQPKRHPRM